jgi:type IV fimbrial biogenesis protein FimT
MLEQMKYAPLRRQVGFTLIELVVVIAIAAILLVVVVPSFSTFFAGKRVEGVATELGTDLQFARSEAVSRKTPVRMTFIGDRCYVIHREALAVSTCISTDPDGLNQVLKSVALDASSTASFVSVPAFIAFEPVRGTATTAGAITVGSSVGNAQLQASVSAVGRMQLCVPTGYSVPGYKSC